MHLRSALRRRLVAIAEAVLPYLDDSPRVRPDRSGRVNGRTVPLEASEPNDIPLGDRLRSLPEMASALLSGAAIEVLRPEKGDVIIVRSGYLTTESGADKAAYLAAFLAKQGVLLVLLPEDCRVHVERKAKPAEDLGYRETKNVSVDAGVAPTQSRPPVYFLNERQELPSGAMSGETLDSDEDLDGETGKQVCGAEKGSG